MGRMVEVILPRSRGVSDEPQHQRPRSPPARTGDLPRHGESMTSVVKEALRERYARIEGRTREASVEELLAIADRAAAHVKRPYIDHARLLYDENGLPK